MAVFQWVGSTAANQSRYDWNTPSNWNKIVPGGGFTISTVSPGPGDTVILGGGSTTLSPLLFGGYSGDASGGTWLNASQSTGHTFNSAIEGINISISPTYPWLMLGGGLTSGVYEWVKSSLTGQGGLSGIAINISDPRTASLKLKTKTINISNPVSDVYINLNFVDNINQVGGGTGAIAGTMAGQSTSPVRDNTFFASNAGILHVSGGVWDQFQIYPDYTRGITSHSLSRVSSLIANEIRTKTHTFIYDSDVTGGRMYVDGGNYFPGYSMVFMGTLDQQSVLEKVYPVGGLTGEIEYGDSSLHLSSPSSYGWRFPFATFFLGDYNGNTTSKMAMLKVDSDTSYTEGPIYPCPWSVEIAGSVSINQVLLSYSRIAASSAMRSSSKASLGTVNLNNNSTIDFGSNPEFDNWEIGSATGSAGGIIFSDENSRIVGSSGLRLWGTQMKFGNRIDSRLGTVKNSGVKYSLPSTPEAI